MYKVMSACMNTEMIVRMQLLSQRCYASHYTPTRPDLNKVRVEVVKQNE